MNPNLNRRLKAGKFLVLTTFGWKPIKTEEPGDRMPTCRTFLKRGFTLIEMLLVLVIIGIVVAIAIPALGNAKANAQQSKRNAIETAVAIAKTRAFLANNILGGSPATFAQFDEYLLVNGDVATLNQLADKTQNGAGYNIASWGEFPEGPDIVGITWDDTDIVTE